MARDPRWVELPRKGPLGWALTLAGAGGGIGSFLIWAGGLSARLEERALAQGGQGAVRGLAPGSIPGLGLRDASDHQWRNFRGGIPALCLVLLVWAILGHAQRASAPRLAVAAQLVRLGLMWGFLFFLHGAGAGFVALLALGGFLAARLGASLEKKYKHSGVILVWVFNLASLMAVFLAPTGFWSFRTFHRGLAFLDAYQGMVGFVQSYRIQILRQLSFGMDLIWADGAPRHQDQKKKGQALPDEPGSGSIQDREERDYKFRSQSGGAETPPGFVGGGSADEWGLGGYLAYMFYPPLYLTGPIISFNAFQSYQNWPQRVYAAKDLIKYGAFVFGLCAILEVWNHKIYASLFTTNQMWQWKNAPGLGIGSKEIMSMSFLVLAFMWAKFTVIWGTARFFALLDGVAPPENMRRFFADNHTVTEFWKNWHASYNRWLVRYLYVPLGGDKNRLLNVWVIFTFVAVWHEINVRLIGWAWVMALFLGPEIVANKIASGEWARRSRGTVWYRELAAAAATVNVIVLIFGNLIGFQIGISGARAFLSDIFGREMWLALLYTACFYGVVHLQFAKRRLEVQGRIDSKKE